MLRRQWSQRTVLGYLIVLEQKKKEAGEAQEVDLITVDQAPVVVALAVMEVAAEGY
jgi:hypothetical protein